MNAVERPLGEKILEAERVGGGCISHAQRVRTASGVYFCKQAHQATNLFMEEARGLEAIGALGFLRVPKVIRCTPQALVLEWLQTESPREGFWASFGRKLAQMHAVPQLTFGFPFDNHIGNRPQSNPVRARDEISWTEYFVEFRLKPMLNLPEASSDALLNSLFAKALPAIRRTLDEVHEPPSLVHGDLWSGNYLCVMGQQPAVIDPASYYGHREVDLAMSELFGGFAPEFYAAYQKEAPLQPGYERRKPIYNLYHLLNHWQFGESYKTQTYSLLRAL